MQKVTLPILSRLSCIFVLLVPISMTASFFISLVPSIIIASTAFTLVSSSILTISTTLSLSLSPSFYFLFVLWLPLLSSLLIPVTILLVVSLLFSPIWSFSVVPQIQS